MRKQNKNKGQPSPLRGTGKIYAWLREHVAHTSQNCLKFPFYISPKLGYPLFGLNGKMTYAHRWMCEQKNGPAPTPKHEAAHTCGNAHMGCINPNHLEWKTRGANAQDRLAHGNYSLRKGQPRFLLTAEKAAQIKALKGQKTQFELAEMFGVSRCTISSIHCGRGWTGEGRKSRPFTPGEVSDILSRRPDATLQALADEYGVKISTMQRICAGKTYKYQDAYISSMGTIHERLGSAVARDLCLRRSHHRAVSYFVGARQDKKKMGRQLLCRESNEADGR